MKIAYIIGCALPLLAAGCKHEARCTPSQSPPGAKTVSDGNFTWTLGAAKINGTNVPLDDIEVRAITNRTAK